MKLTPKQNTPEDPQPIAWTVGQMLPVLMLLAKRQDQLFFMHTALERHQLNIDAGFVLTSFEQAALFKKETHELIAGINALFNQVELWKSLDTKNAHAKPE